MLPGVVPVCGEDSTQPRSKAHRLGLRCGLELGLGFGTEASEFGMLGLGDPLARASWGAVADAPIA